MQPPMPVMVGASTAFEDSLLAIASAPFFSAASRTSFAGRAKRIAKPQAQGPFFAAKSEANESGCSLTRKLHSPWRYSVTTFDLCFATAVKPSFGNNSCSTCESGAANSTNSKPSTPIGFSNVVGRMPILGWALMGISDQRISNGYSNARRMKPFLANSVHQPVNQRRNQQQQRARTDQQPEAEGEPRQRGCRGHAAGSGDTRSEQSGKIAAHRQRQEPAAHREAHQPRRRQFGHHRQADRRQAQLAERLQRIGRDQRPERNQAIRANQAR